MTVPSHAASATGGLQAVDEHGVGGAELVGQVPEGALPGALGQMRFEGDQSARGLLSDPCLDGFGLVAVVAGLDVHELVREDAAPLGGGEAVVQPDPPGPVGRPGHAVRQSTCSHDQARGGRDGIPRVEGCRHAANV